MKCETCHRHLDAEKHTTYRFPKDMRSGSQENEQMVFCCYDCMCAFLFKHMDKQEAIREEKKCLPRLRKMQEDGSNGERRVSL